MCCASLTSETANIQKYIQQQYAIIVQGKHFRKYSSVFQRVSLIKTRRTVMIKADNSLPVGSNNLPLEVREK
jgi:hypothetical protein